MARRRKLVSVRKPRLKVTPKGIRVTKPTARIGGKAGLNISSRGVSASYRTKHGTLTTRGNGFTRRRRKPGCSLATPLVSLIVVASLRCIPWLEAGVDT